MPRPFPEDAATGHRRAVALVRPRQSDASPAYSTTTLAPSSRERWPNASSTPRPTVPIVDRVERARSARLGRGARPRTPRRSGFARRRRGRRPRLGPRARTSRATRRARRSSARDHVRRGHRRRRRRRSRSSCPTIATTARRCSSLPTATPFAFAYGPGFARPATPTKPGARGLEVRIVRDPDLALRRRRPVRSRRPRGRRRP